MMVSTFRGSSAASRVSAARRTPEEVRTGPPSGDNDPVGRLAIACLKQAGRDVEHVSRAGKIEKLNAVESDEDNLAVAGGHASMLTVRGDVRKGNSPSFSVTDRLAEIEVKTSLRPPTRSHNHETHDRGTPGAPDALASRGDADDA